MKFQKGDLLETFDNVDRKQYGIFYLILSFHNIYESYIIYSLESKRTFVWAMQYCERFMTKVS